jgi:hypothetical protein
VASLAAAVADPGSKADAERKDSRAANLSELEAKPPRGTSGPQYTPKCAHRVESVLTDPAARLPAFFRPARTVVSLVLKPKLTPALVEQPVVWINGRGRWSSSPPKASGDPVRGGLRAIRSSSSRSNPAGRCTTSSPRAVLFRPPVSRVRIRAAPPRSSTFLDAAGVCYSTDRRYAATGRSRAPAPSVRSPP